MIVLLSPAKTMDFTVSAPAGTPHTKPRFHAEANMLTGILQGFSAARIAKLMDVSTAIAERTCKSYSQWKKKYNPRGARQAMLAYQGDVYVGLKASTFDADELAFAQRHVRILSGLYGMLRPLDLIQPYRLEMGAKLKTAAGGNLYEFWGEKIMQSLRKDLAEMRDPFVLNLTSNEYFKAIHAKHLGAPVISATFKEEKDGKFRFLTTFGKQARGQMAWYLVKRRITKADELASFREQGYRYNKSLSRGDNLCFTRRQP